LKNYTFHTFHKNTRKYLSAFGATGRVLALAAKVSLGALCGVFAARGSVASTRAEFTARR